MRQVILVFAVLAVIAIGVIAFTTRDGMRVAAPPQIGGLPGNGCQIYRFEDDQARVVVSFPSGWIITAQSRSGGSSYYRANATFSKADRTVSATVRRDSFSPVVVFIEERPFMLTNGTVFRIRALEPPQSEQMTGDHLITATGLEVTQVPFAPLDVTSAYANELNDYFTKREEE